MQAYWVKAHRLKARTIKGISSLAKDLAVYSKSSSYSSSSACALRVPPSSSLIYVLFNVSSSLDKFSF